MKNLFFLMIFFVTLLMSCEEDPWVPMEPSNPSIRGEINIGINKSVYSSNEIITPTVLFQNIDDAGEVTISVVNGSSIIYVKHPRIPGFWVGGRTFIAPVWAGSYSINFTVEFYTKYMKPTGFVRNYSVPFTVK